MEADFGAVEPAGDAVDSQQREADARLQKALEIMVKPEVIEDVSEKKGTE